jgi:hypothetical protein
MKTLIFVSVMTMIAGCHSAPIHPHCTNKNVTCPLGTQKECLKTREPCTCECHSLNSNPFSPQPLQDQNRFGFPKEEHPSNQELESPLGGD